MSNLMPSVTRRGRRRSQELAREHRTMRRELIRIREGLGWSQRELAARMGVTQQAIHKFEQYDNDPRLSTIRRYANAVQAVIRHSVVVDNGIDIDDWQSQGELRRVIHVPQSTEDGDARVRWAYQASSVESVA